MINKQRSTRSIPALMIATALTSTIALPVISPEASQTALAASTQADTYSPGYDVQDIARNIKKSSAQVKDENIPEGTKFSIQNLEDLPAGWTVRINERTGTVLAYAPYGTQVKKYTALVTATYPDGSQDENISAVFSLENAPGIQHNLEGYEPAYTQQGKKVISTPIKTNFPEGTRFEFDYDAQLPKGTKFTFRKGMQLPNEWQFSVNSTNGAVTGFSPFISGGGDILVPIKATLPDGSVENMKSYFRVIETDTMITQGYGYAETNPGRIVSLPFKDANKMIPGVRYDVFEDEIPHGWNATVTPNGNLTVEIAKETTPGIYTIPVSVISPDNDVLKASATIKVGEPDLSQKDSYSGKYTFTYPNSTVNTDDIPVSVEPKLVGETTTQKIAIFKQGKSFENLPQGWSASVDVDTGEITISLADDADLTPRNLDIIVAYTDGSQEVTVPIRITPKKVEKAPSSTTIVAPPSTTTKPTSTTSKTTSTTSKATSTTTKSTSTTSKATSTTSKDTSTTTKATSTTSKDTSTQNDTSTSTSSHETSQEDTVKDTTVQSSPVKDASSNTVVSSENEEPTSVEDNNDAKEPTVSNTSPENTSEGEPSGKQSDEPSGETSTEEEQSEKSTEKSTEEPSDETAEEPTEDSTSSTNEASVENGETPSQNDTPRDDQDESIEEPNISLEELQKIDEDKENEEKSSIYMNDEKEDHNSEDTTLEKERSHSSENTAREEKSSSTSVEEQEDELDSGFSRELKEETINNSQDSASVQSNTQLGNVGSDNLQGAQSDVQNDQIMSQTYTQNAHQNPAVQQAQANGASYVKKVGPAVHTGGQIEHSTWIEKLLSLFR